MSNSLAEACVHFPALETLWHFTTVNQVLLEPRGWWHLQHFGSWATLTQVSCKRSQWRVEWLVIVDWTVLEQGSLNIHNFGGIKESKCMGMSPGGFPYGAWSLGWWHRMTPVINIRHDLGITLQVPLISVTVTQDWTLCRFLYASWIFNGRRGHTDWFFGGVKNVFFFLKKPCGTVSQAFPLILYPSFHLGVRDFFVQQAHWNSWEVKWFVIPKQLRAAKGRWMTPPFPLVKFGRWRVPWIWGRKWRLVPWMMDDLEDELEDEKGWGFHPVNLFWIEIWYLIPNNPIDQ